MPDATAAHRRRLLPGGRPFHLLLGSLAASSCGDWLYNVALLAFVYAHTGSATWLALTTAARVLPFVVFGPLGGVLADRVDRRRLIIASDLVRAVLMVALAGVVAAGLPVALAPLLAAAATVAGTVQPPSVAASTARLVAADELGRANAARAAIGQAAVVAGPALGALLLVVSSPALAILANGLSFLASAAAVAAIPAGPAFRPGRRDAGAASSLLAELRGGVDALRGAPDAMRVVAADVICSAVYGLLTVTLVLVSRHVGAGSAGYGLLLGAFGAGGLAGAAVAGRLDASDGWRGTLAVALALVALPVAALGVVSSLWMAIALGIAGGAGSVVAEVLSETVLPLVLDDDVLARAYGLVLPASLAGIVAGSLVAAPLVALLGLAAALAAAGVAVLGAGALLLRRPLRIAVPSRDVVVAPSV
jgi:MFS family permease